MDTLNQSKTPTPSSADLSFREESPTSPKNSIIIIGPNQSHIQALCIMLASALDADCTCQNNLPHDALLDSPANENRIYLIDCMGGNLDRIQKQIHGQVHTSSSNPKIVLFNTASDFYPNLKIRQNDVWGIFFLNDSKSFFLQGMRAILKGSRWVDRSPLPAPVVPPLMTDSVSQDLIETLSPREKQILQFVADGLSNSGIANELDISMNTVKTHIYHIYKKLSVSNRLQAARRIEPQHHR